MLTAVEENYVKGLINQYRQEGYVYYVCHTVTEQDNQYDVYLYLSKDKIIAITQTSYEITGGIFIKIDSSNRNDSGYNPSTNSRSILANNNFTSVIDINRAEFIYTNAYINYKSSELVYNPNLMINSADSYSNLYLSILCVVVLIITFLYTFFTNVLRIRK